MQNKYERAERMKGVFLDYKKDYRSQAEDYSLTVLINDPFNAQISIEIDIDEWNKYVNYDFADKWRTVLDSPPKNCGRNDFYFNLQEGEFYITSTVDDKYEPVWEKATLTNIVNMSRAAWRFSRHIHTDFNRYHAGQLCDFSAYAIDANENLCKPSSIKKDFHEYRWIFYPTTFQAHEISENTIKYLVEKTPISKETRDIAVRSYQNQNKAKQQKEKER